MKKIIKLKDVDPLLFSGTGDENLNYLEDMINGKIFLRGDEIHFDGIKKELILVESLINDMIYTINLKGYLGTYMFSDLLDLYNWYSILIIVSYIVIKHFESLIALLWYTIFIQSF